MKESSYSLAPLAIFFFLIGFLNPLSANASEWRDRLPKGYFVGVAQFDSYKVHSQTTYFQDGVELSSSGSESKISVGFIVRGTADTSVSVSSQQCPYSQVGEDGKFSLHCTINEPPRPKVTSKTEFFINAFIDDSRRISIESYFSVNTTTWGETGREGKQINSSSSYWNGRAPIKMPKAPNPNYFP